MQLNEEARITVQRIYVELRRVAASDPRAARQTLVEFVRSCDARLDGLLRLMRPASEGRMRQLVANTVNAMRHEPGVLDRFVPHLLTWQQSEPDEFTKPAISAALQGLDLDSYTTRNSEIIEYKPSPKGRHDPLFSAEAIGIYRWVAGRLCHRVRNFLELPTACLADAIRQASGITNDAVRSNITRTLVEAQQSLREVGRTVGFSTDDDAFRWREIDIIRWLERMTERYRSEYEPVYLEVDCKTHSPAPRILANDVLLDVVFSNLWRNSAQAVQGRCVITARVAVVDHRVGVVVLDAGPGLRPEHVPGAFSDRLSTRGEDHGRGLLEVADAMHRLEGAAQVVSVEGQNRIELLFPLVLDSRNEAT
jgi:hypothetical protein